MFRCSVATVHEAMLIASKLKLAQYKLHNPVFQDNRILRNNLEKKQVTHFSDDCYFLMRLVYSQIQISICVYYPYCFIHPWNVLFLINFSETTT